MKKKKMSYSMGFEKEEPIITAENNNVNYNYHPSIVEMIMIVALAVGIITGGISWFSSKLDEDQKKEKEFKNKIPNITNIETHKLIQSTTLFLRKHYGHLDKNTKTYYGNNFLNKTKFSYKKSNFKYLQFTKLTNNECYKLSQGIVDSKFQYKIQSLSINNKIVETKNDKEVFTNCSITTPSTIKINL